MLLLVVANQVKEQFESNSQPLEERAIYREVVANQVKEQFESNSQLRAWPIFYSVCCGEPS